MALYANGGKKRSCLLYGVLRNSKDMGRVKRECAGMGYLLRLELYNVSAAGQL